MVDVQTFSFHLSRKLAVSLNPTLFTERLSVKHPAFFGNVPAIDHDLDSLAAIVRVLQCEKKVMEGGINKINNNLKQKLLLRIRQQSHFRLQVLKLLSTQLAALEFQMLRNGLIAQILDNELSEFV
jgi:hypothetical protein